MLALMLAYGRGVGARSVADDQAQQAERHLRRHVLRMQRDADNVLRPTTTCVAAI
jgi:hypothetical protein